MLIRELTICLFGDHMADCPVCKQPLTPPTVRCSNCGTELHKDCGKRGMGKWYCKDCYKRAKKGIKFEQMAQRSSILGPKRQGKYGKF
jgi:hypothetical protein